MLESFVGGQSPGTWCAACTGQVGSKRKASMPNGIAVFFSVCAKVNSKKLATVVAKMI